MLREVKRFFKVNLGDGLVGLALCAGAGLISSLLRMIFNNSFDISFFLMLAVLYGGLLGYSYVGLQFNLALRMGALRRNYLFGAAVFSFLVCFVLLMLTNLWVFVDIGLLALRGIRLAWAPVIAPLPAVALALVSTLFGCLMGAITVRAYRWGNWVVAACLMVPSFGWLPIANALDSGRTDAFARLVQGVALAFGQLPAYSFLVLAGIGLLAVVAVTWLLVRRVAVHD